MPLPATFDASTPLSADNFLTDGGIGIAAAAAGADAGFGTSAALGDEGTAALGAAPAPSLICPSSAPTATVSPFLAATAESTPAPGAGPSNVTLSAPSAPHASSPST